MLHACVIFYHHGPHPHAHVEPIKPCDDTDDSSAHAVSPSLTLHCADPAPIVYNVYLKLLPPKEAAEAVRFFTARVVQCLVDEASVDTLADALAHRQTETAILHPGQWNGRHWYEGYWTDALVRALATRLPEHCRVQTVNSAAQFDRVLGDYRLIAGRATSNCCGALRSGAHVVETRVRLTLLTGKPAPEFTIPRARGALIRTLIMAMHDRLMLWGWMGCGWSHELLHVNVHGELLDREQSLEAYGVDDETPLDLVFDL